MVRTRIQFPDELYRQLRAIADAKEWSFAETLRRAAEIFVQMQPQKRRSKKPWTIPRLDLGKLLLPEEKWAEALEDDQIERHLR